MDHDLVQRFANARRDRALVVLEGFHALKHALRFDADVALVAAVDPEELETLARRLAPELQGRFTTSAVIVDRATFDALAPQAPPTGVIALARRPAIELGRVLADPQPRPAVLLEDPRNLSNMGACVRVAAAAGAAAVLTTGDHDPWHPDAVRGAAGLHFALPVTRVTDLPQTDRPLLAVDPSGEPLVPGELPARAVLAFGTERYGLTPRLLSRADACVAIPMEDGVSSLNLATSVAAVLFAWRLARAPR